MKSIFSPVFAVALLSLVLTGCGGGGADVKQTTTTTTMGQELVDLQASYEKGILTEQEYKDAKNAILKRYK